MQKHCKCEQWDLNIPSKKLWLERMPQTTYKQQTVFGFEANLNLNAVFTVEEKAVRLLP